MEEYDLSELRNKCLTSLYNCTGNIFKYFEEEDLRAAEFDRLKACVVQYCKMEVQEKNTRKAIQSIEEQSDIEDWNSIQQNYQNILAKDGKKIIKFDQHQYMQDYHKFVEAAKESHRVQNSVQDIDLVVTQSTDQYIDPISKKRIVVPMRNKVCNHVYDKETIELIVTNKKNRGCPYVGCKNKKTMSDKDLELDEELQLTINQTQQASTSEG